MRVQILDYLKIDDRRMIGKIRVKAMEYVAGLALATTVIPIAIGGFRDLPIMLDEEKAAFDMWCLFGWGSALSAIFAAMLFIVSVPKHIERYKRRLVLNIAYVVAPMALVAAAISFSYATFLTLHLPTPSSGS